MIALFDSVNISAESRFFIQCFLIYNHDDSPPFRVRDVAKDLQLTERLVRDAVQNLVQAGLLRGVKIEGLTGRPGTGYVCTDYLRSVLYKDAPDFIHYEMMNRLFAEPEIYAISAAADSNSDALSKAKPRAAVRGDGRPAAPGPKGRLSAASRILLVALLSAADECGVVTGLGEKRLREITGLDSLQLKQQFKRLLNLGFIRSYVPGVSNGIFNGSKVKSIYYLNLTHPQICPKHSKTGLVMYVVQADLQREWLNRMLFGNVAEKNCGARVRAMLYHQLARYASMLLAALWKGGLDEFERVRKCMTHSACSDSCEPLTLIRQESLWERFCLEAEDCASRFYKVLLKADVWPGYTPNRVSIIPAPINEEAGRSWTFLSLVVEPQPEDCKTCIAVWELSKLKVQRFEREDQIDTKSRYDAALLTKPT